MIIRSKSIDLFNFMFFLLFCTFFYAQSYSETKDLYVPCNEMPQLISSYTNDLNSLQYFYLIRNSPEKRERLEKFNMDYLTRLNNINFDMLSHECKADYILFKKNLNEILRLLDIEEQEFQNLKPWFPFANKIYELEKIRRRGIQPDSKQLALDFNQITTQIEELQVRLLEKKGLNATTIMEADRTIEGLKTALTRVFEFYNGYDPLFTWWIPVPYHKLDSALTAYANTFKEKESTLGKYGIIARYPAGRNELNHLLEYELIPYTVEDLEIIAQKEFEWTIAELKKVSSAIGLGDDWKAALERAKETYVEPGKQPEAILKLYNESVDFIKEKDLITVSPLAEEVWGMRMRYSERGSGGYFQGGRSITITYPTNNWDTDFRVMSMRGNNPNFSFATVHHELIPGHNLQYFMNDRHRTYRNFMTPFWMEGWALYWEFLLWDMNFPQTPEEKLGMLFWRLHRSARIIFTINFQTGKWTPEEAVNFLIEEVGHEEVNAISEIQGHVRVGNNPLYQMSYLLGGLQFYSLKEELVDSGKMTYKEFHDEVMHLNAMPVEMIRAIMTNGPLEKDFKTKWKFYK